MLEAVAGFVLHAMVCSQDNASVCRELPVRHEPTSLYVCLRAEAVAVERVPSIDFDGLGFSGPVHVTFSCKPVEPRA